jgi:lipoate-protein ligase A
MHLEATFTPDAPSAENMARDEAMQDSLLPCLRLYSWAPDAISLGCSQQVDILDIDACRENGVMAVKRFTGGAAVLHKDDLTYAFFWPARVPPHYRAIDLRERFKEIFLASFAELGVEARECKNAKWKMPATNICFHGQAANEIVIEGRKVAGNAQRVTRKGVFQHGSIIFHNHEDLFCRLVRNATPSAAVTGLCEHVPDATPEHLAEIMIKHAARVFELELAE